MAIKKGFAGILCAVFVFLSFGVFAQAQEEPLKLVVLGDSIAKGAGVICDSNTFANRIAAERGYALQNFGKGGDTSGSLLYKVTENEGIREAIRGADIITVSIGGNDFYPSVYLIATGLLGDIDWMEPRRAALKENYGAAIDEIRALKNPDALLIVQTLYNPVFSFMPPTAHVMYEEVVLGINAVIRGYLEEHPGAYRIADVYAAFQGRHGLVFIDMVHPSDCGHGVIAEVITATIDGTAPPQPGMLDSVLDFFVWLLQPLLALADWGIVGALRFLRDDVPGVWDWMMGL